MVAEGLSYGINMHGLCDSSSGGSEAIFHRIMGSRIFPAGKDLRVGSDQLLGFSADETYPGRLNWVKVA